MSLGRRSMLSIFAGSDANRGLCPNGCNKGFLRTTDGRRRDARRCMRCKGTGFVAVGNTKR
jgi:hypothetical protein